MGTGKSARPRQRMKPLDRKALIIKEAVELASEYGYQSNLGFHTAIAYNLQCSSGTVFSYYPTRKHLVDAVLEWAKDPEYADTEQAKRINATFDLYGNSYLETVEFADLYKQSRK